MSVPFYQLFPLAVRRDKDDQLLPAFWPHLKRHLRHSASGSADAALHYAGLLDAGKAKAKAGATFENALANPLGMWLSRSLVNSFLCSRKYNLQLNKI